MVEDVIVKDAQAVIAMESPHRDEVESGLALSGQSGRVAGRVLTNTDAPLGVLCKTGKIQFSIVNTFSNPIKFDIQGHERTSVMRQINELAYGECHGSRDYMTRIKNILNQSQEMLVDGYRKRLMEAIDLAAEKKVVVCGLIAQAVFELAFHGGGSEPSFLKPSDCLVGAHTVAVFYVWHPSPNSGKNGVSSWELPKNSKGIERLKNFVSKT